MFIDKPAPFIKTYIDELDEALRKLDMGKGLSRLQKIWLGICLLGILITNTVCWAKIERGSLGSYTRAGLSWMFRKAKIPWEKMLTASTKMVLRGYQAVQGMLIVDDTEKRRAKKTKRIYRAHKMKDKKTGGYINGQSLVVLLLVTPKVTIPVGVEFYQPDPALSAWKEEEEELKKKGVPKKERPPKPAPSEAYPDKKIIALRLITEFKSHFPRIKVKAVLADALYGTEDFVDQITTLFDGTHIQVISQLRSNQTVRFHNRKVNLEDFFAKHPAKTQTITVRGQKRVVTWAVARLYVFAHQKKRLILAVKYEGEDEYRYLFASDLSWRAEDVLEVYGLRWLVEVFLQDWKSYEGWDQLAKQPDQEGSSRSLILSLLLDHCLLLHPDQIARLENNLPLATLGSLQEKIKAEYLLLFIKDLLDGDDVEQKLERLSHAVAQAFQLAPSSKHMSQQEVIYFSSNFRKLALS
jgi:hypothetical protein